MSWYTPGLVGVINIDKGIVVSDPLYNDGNSKYINVISNIRPGKYIGYERVKIITWPPCPPTINKEWNESRVGELYLLHESINIKELDKYETFISTRPIGVDSAKCGIFDAEYFYTINTNRVLREGFSKLMYDTDIMNNAIIRKGAAPEYLLPVKFLDGDTEYDAFAPRGSIRIKMKGGGLNFVHGGISLQEMVVPLIDYRFLRNDSKEYKKNKAAI